MTFLRTSRQRHKQPKRRSERGASAVEFAIILPVLMFLLLGMIEFGLVLKNINILSNAANAGARNGSVEARNDIYNTVAELSAEGVLKTNGINADYIVVYKANRDTGLPDNGGATWNTNEPKYETCSSKCVIYTGTSGTYSSAGGPGWAASTQQACGDRDHTDAIGVYVSYNHKYITSLFGSTKQIRQHAVYRLEPVPADSITNPCA
jgi:Flp pilus assembly protein TadG